MAQSIQQLLTQLTSYSNETHQTSSILKKMAQISKMNEKFMSIIPHSLQKDVKIINIRQQHLILEATSGAVAAKLNLLKTDLMASIRQYLIPGLVSIEIKVKRSYES